ncbi:major facilitator superfamily domain-containing protein [Coniella lustricola]|uniref:Major facilitator superfamily domain-containing protein n=1 Tax=Coniella lustricola TaxID=2025994 RepID=A0A2T3AKQ3_9PEZI|nr:major facilitator superfamily domain-containing protein [Coniella lustricola]
MHRGNHVFHNHANDFAHIADPNLRRRLALSEIDKVSLGLYHVRAVLVAGVGFFLDSYDIFAINLISTFLGLAFWSGSPADASGSGSGSGTGSYGFGGNNGTLPTSVAQILKASVSVGVILGQVVFGWLADVWGRRRMYGVELIIIIVATLLCALVSPSQSMNSTALLTFWRVVMGVGIGGDYPLSSVITSEFAPTKWRGAMMAGVFSMQGVGQLAAALVTLVVTVSFKSAFESASQLSECDYRCQVAADRCWRIIVGVGAIPACFALYFRLTIPETPRYTFDIAHDVEMADANIHAFVSSKAKAEVDIVRQARLKKLAGPSLAVPSASWRDLRAYFGQWTHLRVLLGTTLSWFFLDLAFYGLGLNNALILSAIGYSSGATLFKQLYNTAVGTIILAVAGSLPGYLVAIFTVDAIGRKPLQFGGFMVLTILFAIIGFAYNHLLSSSSASSTSSPSLFALYILAQFFFNLGPNTTTFIVPGECFPTRYRATGHGVSAAAGKIGAIVAQIISIPMLSEGSTSSSSSSSSSSSTTATPWLGSLMRLFALFMLCGTLVTLLIPETKGLTLEELAGEDRWTGSGNDGGSRGRGRKRGSWWAATNPFVGGKPAGFAAPRTSTTHNKTRTKTRKYALNGDSKGSNASTIPPSPSPSVPSLSSSSSFWWRSGAKSNKLNTKSKLTRKRYGITGKDNSFSSSSTAVGGRGGHGRGGGGGTRNSSSSITAFNQVRGGPMDRGESPEDIRLQDVGGLMR